MEKLPIIIEDIKEKKGKEWIGIQKATENLLDNLMYFLDDQRLLEHPRLVEELVELYYNAKASDFLKMEAIIRKLDEVRIRFGKDGYVKKVVEKDILNLGKAIDDFRKNIENMLNSAIGSRLLDSTRELIISFYNFLGHPKLQDNQPLFEEMLRTYEAVEKDEFTVLQKMTALLDKLDIKLGSSAEEVVATFKTPEELREELEQTKFELAQEKENISRELKKIEEQKSILKGKEEQVALDQQFLEKERESMKATFESEKQALATERANFESQREAIANEQAQIEAERQAIATERANFEAEKQAIATECANIEAERQKLASERAEVEAELKQQIATERAKIEAERQALAAERQKIDSERANPNPGL